MNGGPLMNLIRNIVSHPAWSILENAGEYISGTRIAFCTWLW